MTSLLPPLTPPPPGPRPSARGDLLARHALAAAVWAAVAGLVATGLPVLLVWIADSPAGSAAGSALRAAGQLWLLAHGCPIALPGGPVGLAPLGLLLLPLLLLLRAGGSAACAAGVASLRSAALLATVLGAGYGSLAAAVAVLSGQGNGPPSPLAALLCAGAVGALGGGAGAVRAAGLVRAAGSAVPGWLRRLLRPVAVATLGLLAAGALAAGAQLATSLEPASELLRAGAPGTVGGLALLLLALALVPNAVVWGAAWWTGPGFAVGAGTVVSPSAVSLGPVPALPLLAALPDAALPPALATATLLVPLAAGGLAGLLLVRRSPHPLRDAGSCGLLTGAGLAALAALSAGSLGDQRLAVVGPSPWQVGLAVAVEVTLGAALAVTVRRRHAPGGLRGLLPRLHRGPVRRSRPRSTARSGAPSTARGDADR